MLPHMRNFSAELLELIFAHLPNKQLCVCMKVCKAWYSVASRKRFEVINDTPLPDLSKNLQAIRFDGRKAGDLVRKIYISPFCSLTRDNFEELMHCLPNLRVLMGISPTCFKFLNDRNILDRLAHLEEILMDEQYGWHYGFVDSFYTLNVQMGNQITSLTLKVLPVYSGGGKFKNLISSLSKFSVLKSLCIGGFSQRGINLSSILNACGSLTSLKLQNDCKWEIDTEHNVIHKSLSALKLCVRDLTENHMKYIIQHLPNLKNLKFWVCKNSFEGLLSAVNPPTIEKFALYLKELDHFEMHESSAPLLRTNNLDSSVKISLFWKFLRDLCGKNCCCDLVIYVLSPAKCSTSTVLYKQNQKVFLQCDILSDSSKYESWVQQLDFLTFRKITLHGRQINQLLQPSSHGHYEWVQPLITLLKQQQHKQVCCINIVSTAQKLEFGNTFQTVKRESTVNFGHLSKIILRSEMLKGLGQLYPFVGSLTFEECMVEKEESNAKTYQIDLSHFEKLGYFIFDLDRMFPEYKIGIPLYLKFINIMTPDSADYYYYREKKRALYHLGGSFKFTTVKTYYLVKIYHAGIESFTFKRFSSNISVIKD